MKENCAVEKETIDCGWNPANPLVLGFPEAFGTGKTMAVEGDLDNGYVDLTIEDRYGYEPGRGHVQFQYSMTCEQALRLASFLNRVVREIRASPVRDCMEIAGADMQQAPEDVQAE